MVIDVRLIDADALMEAINTYPKFGVDERCRIVPWNERYEPYIRLRDAVIAITGMPTIEPERKKGKWIEDAETYYKAVNEKGGGVNENTPYFTDDIACSECLAKFSVIDNEAERFDFCPNCGADMRGEKNETD